MARKQRRPRGSVEQLPSGSFRAVVYAGVDPLTGKERRIKRTAASEAEAYVLLTKLQNEVDEQRHPRSAITIGDVITKWSEVAELEATTRQRYDGLIRNYLGPQFGSWPVGRLDAEILETYYARLRRCRELCERPRRGHECRPLSNSSVRQVHFILRAALDRAVRWQYVGVNQAALAAPPAFVRREPDPPSPEEVASVLNEAWADPAWRMLLWLTMITGCRRGELSALRWRDVDLDRGIVTVHRSNAELVGQPLQEKSTKTTQRRRLGVDPQTVDMLRAHRERIDAVCGELGVKRPLDAFAFSLEPDGSKPIKPSTITQRYSRLATRCGLRSSRLHSLRHYSATELMNAGVDLRRVAQRLGHGSGGATTLRFYAAWVDQVDRSAAATIAGLVPSPSATPRASRHPYEALAAELRTSIESGTLLPGAMLPTVKTLAVAHGVSAGTVNRAVALLKAAGLVIASRGARATVRSELDHGGTSQSP